MVLSLRCLRAKVGERNDYFLIQQFRTTFIPVIDLLRANENLKSSLTLNI